jgi:spore coat protein U-like protein
MKTTIALIFIFLTNLSRAGQDCDFNLSFSQVTTQVLETEQVIQNGINLYRGKDPSGICANYRLFFGKGHAQSYTRKAISAGNATITYNLHNNINKTGILKEQPDALTSQEYIEFYAPEKYTNYQVPFFISIPDLFAQNYPPIGTYTDNLNIVVWVVKNGTFRFDDTANLAVTFIVPTRLDISLVDEGGTFDASSTSKVFDFGNLSLNQEKAADLRVLSNTPYQLRMSSQNAGSLKQGTNNSVSYSILVNGLTVNLAGSNNTPVHFANGNGLSGINGDRFNVRVRITENTTDKLAGLYQDVITITAIAN